MYTNAPPCATPGAPLNPCARSLYRWLVDGHGDLPAEWSGWRLAGRFLVSPDGDRITPERLRGLLFREMADARLRRLKAGAKGQQKAGNVLRLIPARERFDGAG